MKIKIEGKQIESNNVNIVAIDGTNSRLAMAGGYAVYNLTFRGNNRARYDTILCGSMKKMTESLHLLQKSFREQGLNNFLGINDSFLVNLDKVASFNWRYNLLGYQFIFVEFEDGSEYQIFCSTNKNDAEQAYNKLQTMHDEYNKSKTATIVSN